MVSTNRHPQSTVQQGAPASTPAESVTRALYRAARRLSEGPHPWGVIDVTPTGRTVWSRTRLTVYPPGTNSTERRALRFYRVWPVAGAALAILLFFTLSALPVVVVTLLALALYIAGIWAAYAATRDLRPRLRYITVLTIQTGLTIETVGDIASFDDTTDRLRALDALHDQGLIGAAEYEMHWSEIYDALPE
jgi:hypothetical protein